MFIIRFSKPLKRGDRGHDVEHLQILLASHPFLYKEGLITGYYSNLTERAVSSFQDHYKLNVPVVGLADLRTLKELEMVSAVEQVGIAADKVIWLDSLRYGSVGEDVVRLQKALINFESYPEALVTGYFGPLTRKAVARFQKEHYIFPAVGYFGAVTQHRMHDLLRAQRVTW